MESVFQFSDPALLKLDFITNRNFRQLIKSLIPNLNSPLLYIFIAIYINSITFTDLMIETGKGQVNFMYVVNPPQPGLPFLNENHGWLVYVCHYAFLVIFAVVGCYSKVLIDFFKNKFKKPDNLLN